MVLYFNRFANIFRRNLGLVLSPSVLRRKSAVFDVADLSKAKQHWMIIYDLIVNYDLIGDNPPN